MDITKNLEQMLNERTIKVSDIKDLQLTDESQTLIELNKLCETKAAYRIGVDGFVGRQFLWNLILDNIKMENSIDVLTVDGRPISQNIICKMLNSMESEGLIKKENSIYKAVLDTILSKQVLRNFFSHRADQIKIEDILYHFRFKSSIISYGSKVPSAAFSHCQQVVNNLCNEGFIKEDTTNKSFSWNDI